MSELPEKNGRSEKRIVATYPYTDATGKLLFEVVRFEPKDFRQRTPNGNDWHWGLNGTTPVLYRLDKLSKAYKDTLIFVVEGEKDVHSLETIGLLATTAAMGAGKWKPDYSATLRDFPVCILPDNDEPGRQHAQIVAKALAGIAESVTILELPGLPEKGDISDWIAVPGNDAAKLHELYQQARKDKRFSIPIATTLANQHATSASHNPQEQGGFVWNPVNLAERYAADLTPQWYVEHVMVKGQSMVIGAPLKTQKTKLLIDLTVSLVTATPFLGRFTVQAPVRVGVLSAESGEAVIINHIKQVCRARGIDPPTEGLSLMYDVPNFSSDADMKTLADGIKRDGVQVLIVDPTYLGMFAAGKGDQAT